MAEWSDHREHGWREAAYLALVRTGLAAYMAYLWWRFGYPLMFYGEQAEWGREPADAGALNSAFRFAYEDALVLFNPANYEPFGFERLVYVVSSANALYSLLFLLFALTVWSTQDGGCCRADSGLRPRDPRRASPLRVPTTNPLMSTPRFILAAFPLFMVLGATVLEDRKVLARWLLISAAASLVFTALFVGWYFVA